MNRIRKYRISPFSILSILLIHVNILRPCLHSAFSAPLRWTFIPVLTVLVCLAGRPEIIHAEEIGVVVTAETEEADGLRSAVSSEIELGLRGEGLGVTRLDPDSDRETGMETGPAVEEWMEKAWLAYKYFNFDEAERHLDRAERGLRSRMTEESSRRGLFDVRVFQAMLALVDGNRPLAVERMRKAAEIGQAAWIDPLRYPPGVMELFVILSEKILGEAPVHTHLLSEPAGARVYVDGVWVGETPVTLPLRKGLGYFVVLARDDTKPYLQEIAPPLPDNALKAYLTPLGRAELIRTLLDDYYAQPAAGTVALERITEVLAVKTLYLGRVNRDPKGWYLTSAFYRRERGIGVGSPVRLRDEADPVLFREKNTELENVTRRIAQWHRPEPDTSLLAFTRKRWFWPVVAGVVITGGATPFVIQAFERETVTIVVEK